MEHNREMNKKIKELERENNKIDLAILIIGIFLLITILFAGYYAFKSEVLKNQLNECEEIGIESMKDVYCSYLYRETISDSCALGCIYSTKFYYENNNFGDESLGCMLNCINKSQEIQDKFSFCEVIK